VAAIPRSCRVTQAPHAAANDEGAGHRILVVTTGLGLGGAETQLVALAKRLNERGWEVRVVSVTPPGGLAEELQASGIFVSSLEVRRRLSGLRGLSGLARTVRSWQPSVLHAHMVHANVLSRLARLVAPVPVVISTAHSTYEAPTGTRKLREVTWRERAYRLTDPLCDLTTHVSRAGLERYVRVKAIPADKAQWLPNGVDTKLFRPDGQTRGRVRRELHIDEVFVWLAVGRIERPKDYPTLLAAFRRVSGEKATATLLVVGSGSLEKGVREHARELGLGDHVRFLGARRDIAAMMSAADAFVMPSRWEGFSLALVEAMACGLPVVATDCGGPREILDGGRLGSLVPVADPEALAAGMLQVMSLSEEERSQMGDSGRRWVVEHFDIERVVDQWECLYRELLQRAKGRPRRLAGRHE
jgi:glycosyltransferase involved in cell wall biosynthesis